MKTKGWGWFAFFVVVIWAAWLKYPDSEPSAAQEPSTTPHDVQVLVTRQSSDGVTESQFDLNFLTNLEAWILERTVANAQKHWDAAKVPASERIVTGESVYLEKYGHKLAVVRLRIGETTPMATIVGVDGGEVVRIHCQNQGPENVIITSGPCDDKIRQIFQ